MKRWRRRVYNVQRNHVVSRRIETIIANAEQEESAGVRVRRCTGHQLRNVDPFLLFDEFKLTKPADYPDHPHRGFESVTYMLSGSLRHKDFMGNADVINPGDLQCMTAGRGIVHCEMPGGEEVSHGLNLWVNLSKKSKMIEPKYQKVLVKDVPKTTNNGVTVTLLAGSTNTADSPVHTISKTMFLDVKLNKGSSMNQPVPEDYNGFVYIVRGRARFDTIWCTRRFEQRNSHKCADNDAIQVPASHTLILGPGNNLQVKNDGKEVCHFVLIAGKPLDEPVVHSGPYVMSSDEEIMEAHTDFKYRRNGFEGAHLKL